MTQEMPIPAAIALAAWVSLIRTAAPAAGPVRNASGTRSLTNRYRMASRHRCSAATAPIRPDQAEIVGAFFVRHHGAGIRLTNPRREPLFEHAVAAATA